MSAVKVFAWLAARGELSEPLHSRRPLFTSHILGLTCSARRTGGDVVRAPANSLKVLF
jgi:hypothetical protein